MDSHLNNKNMGTYAKPSQILDTRFDAFNKAFASRQKK